MRRATLLLFANFLVACASPPADPDRQAPKLFESGITPEELHWLVVSAHVPRAERQAAARAEIVRGEALLNEGEIEKAMACALRAQELDPTPAAAQLLLRCECDEGESWRIHYELAVARSLLRDGFREEAIARLSRVLRRIKIRQKLGMPVDTGEADALVNELKARR